MPIRADKPSYVVIARPLSGKEAEPVNWLGKFVRSMSRPTEKYAPDTLSGLSPITKYVLDPLLDEDAKVITNSIKDDSWRLKLTDLFDFDRTSHGRKETELKSPRIATYSLRQHDSAFEALMAEEEVRKELIQLLHACDRKAYMIVGVKLVYDGSVSTITDSSTSDTTSITAPVEELAAATGFPLPIPPGHINPKLTRKAEEFRKTDLSHRFTGARIWAFEYKKVTFLKSLVRRISRGPYLLPDGPAQDWSNQTFSSGNPDNVASNEANEVTVDLETERPGMIKSSVDRAEVGNKGIGWQTEACEGGLSPCTMIYEISKETEEEE